MTVAPILGGVFSGTTAIVASTTPSPSTAVTIIIGVGALATTIYGMRWKSDADRAKYTLDVTEGLARTFKEERDDLAAKLEQQHKTLVDAQKAIARLEALPNLERVLELVSTTFERIADRFDETAREHERNDERRHGEILDRINETRRPS